MQEVLSVIDAHPWVMPLVVWPLITALLSLLQKQIEARSPALADALRAAGLDLPGLVKAVTSPGPKVVKPGPGDKPGAGGA